MNHLLNSLKNLNMVTPILTLTLWPINSGVLTSLLSTLSSSLPQRLPAFLEFLMPLKNDLRLMQDGRKAVGVIPYVTGIFQVKQISLHIVLLSVPPPPLTPPPPTQKKKQNQHRLSRMYSNCCCSCSFECENIKIGRSSHKMYSNNILNVVQSVYKQF